MSTMLKKWLEQLLSKGGGGTPPLPEDPLPNPRLSRMLTFGAHMYRSKGKIAEVIFLDDTRGLRKVIVDNDGNIHRFPGILREEKWIHSLTSEHYLKPQIHFRTEFRQEEDGSFRMLWEVQPDGRYWADDDGFGMENDEEICLYTYIDRNGDFTGPFRVYKVGRTYFCQS